MSKITVRGIEYTATFGLEENKIEFTENNVNKVYNLEFIGISIPRKSKDSNGSTGNVKPGSITAEYNLETYFEDQYNVPKKGVVKSDSGSYEKYYNSFKGETGPNIHKAGINSVARAEIGKTDDQAMFFNPIKGFDPVQPIIYDLDIRVNTVTINVIDKPEGTLKYSLDGFITSFDLPQSLNLPSGTYTMGIMHPDDELPFYKAITIL